MIVINIDTLIATMHEQELPDQMDCTNFIDAVINSFDSDTKEIVRAKFKFFIENYA